MLNITTLLEDWESCLEAAQAGKLTPFWQEAFWTEWEACSHVIPETVSTAYRQKMERLLAEIPQEPDKK